jgi:outer membrane protein assembly factor BamB
MNVMNILANFLKSKLFPEWKKLGKTRMVVKKEIGDYYELIEQGLYINLNDRNGQEKWLTNYRGGFGANVPRITSTKLVAKDSVTIDEEGVAHYVTAKDPVEI